jgi:hypothetical protein
MRAKLFSRHPVWAIGELSVLYLTYQLYPGQAKGRGTARCAQISLQAQGTLGGVPLTRAIAVARD